MAFFLMMVTQPQQQLPFPLFFFSSYFYIFSIFSGISRFFETLESTNYD